MKSDLSLFAVFIVKWWNKLFKCVSPPLVGVVLSLLVFLCTPIYARAGTHLVSVNIYENMGNVSLGDENGVIEYNPFGYVYSSSLNLGANDVNVGGVITLSNVSVALSSSIDTYFFNDFCMLLSYGGSQYVLYPVMSEFDEYQRFYFSDITIPVNQLETKGNITNGILYCFQFRAYNNQVLFDNKYGNLTLDYNWSYSDTGSANTNNNPIVNELQNQISQDKEYHDLDKSDATQAGQDMSGFASQLDNLKNTWAILWYPIEFTNKFVQVFTGGTQAAAFDDYDYVSGYRYNNDTGMLEPMMSRSIQSRTAGTGITFPSIELMGYTLWEPYTYDLSTLKDQFPVIFDALYVFISMLEVFWFVGFLRSKYNEVFG